MIRLLCFEYVDTRPFCLVFHDSQTSRRMQSIQKSCGICGSLHRYVHSEHAGMHQRAASFPTHTDSCRSAYAAVVLLLQSLLRFCYCDRCKRLEKRVTRDERPRNTRTSSRSQRVELVNRPHVIVFAHISQQSDTCTSRCFQTPRRRCARRANASASTTEPIHDERMLLFLPNPNRHQTRTPAVNLQPAPFVRCSCRYQRR